MKMYSIRLITFALVFVVRLIPLAVPHTHTQAHNASEARLPSISTKVDWIQTKQQCTQTIAWRNKWLFISKVSNMIICHNRWRCSSAIYARIWRLTIWFKWITCHLYIVHRRWWWWIWLLHMCTAPVARGWQRQQRRNDRLPIQNSIRGYVTEPFSWRTVTTVIRNRLSGFNVCHCYITMNLRAYSATDSSSSCGTEVRVEKRCLFLFRRSDRTSESRPTLRKLPSQIGIQLHHDFCI